MKDSNSTGMAFMLILLDRFEGNKWMHVTTCSLINHRGHRAHRDGKRFIDGEDYWLCH